MTSSKPKFLIRLLQRQPRGGPLGSDDLKNLGISAPLAYQYVQRGWLTKLGRGVFMFPDDDLQLEACIRFLAKRMPGLHVGGKTALAWRGVRHNLAVKERLCLWGSKSGKLPEWFSSRFRSCYSARHLFSPEMPETFGLSPLPETPDGPPVSEPERALLEMLSEVGLQQSMEEARHIMEGIRSPRPEVLQTLLQHCSRVKVVRLCVQWAEQLGLPWAGDARRFAAKTRAANRSRWMARMKDGTTLVLKP